ncbi:MAG TPA: OmpH family outer membrane protein [Candidatus Kapabacteria bacterium]|nr:OmpH family outer membrane protein [Candidatus Kapabacteria bacterium]
MHSVKRISFLAVIAAVVFSYGSAFAQKIGWVDGNDVMSTYSEYIKVQDKLKAQGKVWSDSLQMMQKAAQDKADNYRKILSTMSDDAKQKASAELDQLGQQIQQYQVTKFSQTEGEYAKLTVDLMKPVQEKVHAAIVAVAKKKKLDLILDKGSLVYPQTTAELNGNLVDVTADVKAALK